LADFLHGDVRACNSTGAEPAARSPTDFSRTLERRRRILRGTSQNFCRNGAGVSARRWMRHSHRLLGTAKDRGEL